MNSFRLWLFSGCYAGVLSMVCAQEPEPQPPDPPQMPLVTNVANVAAWRIAYEPKSNSSSAKPSPAGHMIRELQVTKSDKTRRFVTLFADGTTTEAWFIGVYELIDTGAASDVFIARSDRSSFSAGPMIYNFAASDFPELSWIALGNYAGIVSFHGRKCYHYKIKAFTPKPIKPLPGAFPAPLPPRAPTPDREAWVDAKTKLPAGAVEGNFEETYTFKTEGVELPSMPERFTSALQKYLAREKIH